jgi:hypothetical protein
MVKPEKVEEITILPEGIGIILIIDRCFGITEDQNQS